MPVVVVQDVRSGRNELVPAAVERDPPSVDDDDPGHQVGEGGQLVGDDDEGEALGDEPREHLDQPVLAGDVDPGRRFVHDEDVGLAGQCAGNEHAALLAPGQGADIDAGPVGEADEFERPADLLPVGAGGDAQPGLPGQSARGHDLRHRDGH